MIDPQHSLSYSLLRRVFCRGPRLQYRSQTSIRRIYVSLLRCKCVYLTSPRPSPSSVVLVWSWGAVLAAESRKTRAALTREQGLRRAAQTALVKSENQWAQQVT